MSSLNEDQIRAVLSDQGGLLQAGAGAGKTTVIVEHLIYLLEKNRKLGLGSEALSLICIITFTKKAARELRERIRIKVDGKFQVSGHAYWKDILKNLSDLRVSTIHGLFQSILKSDTLIGGNTSYELKDFDSYVERYADEYIEMVPKSFVNFYISNLSSIKESLRKVFNDGPLRIAWESKDEDMSWNQFCKMPFIHRIRGSVKLIYEVDQKWHSSNWYIFLVKVDFTFKNSISVPMFIQDLHEYFTQEIKRLPVLCRDSNVKEELGPLWEDIKVLYYWIKKNTESVSNINRVIIKNRYVDILKNCFNYIKNKIDFLDYYNFADLEYRNFHLLQNAENLKRVQKEFEYIIIDEFQDTSNLQFHLIKKLIGGDERKLYCVGDVKQAIYRFRGGELEVFLGHANDLNNIFILKQNYRSHFKVLQFINELFVPIFRQDPLLSNLPKSQDFLNILAANGDTLGGNIYTLGTKGQLHTNDLVQIEAELIANKINALLLASEKDNIAVLYKFLRPSRGLIDQLKKKNIAFKAQVKIDYGIIPLFNFFHVLVEIEDNEEFGNIPFLKMVYNMYADQSIECFDSFLEKVNAFHSMINFIGLFNSFYKLVVDLRIVDNYNILSFISDTCSKCSENYSELLLELEGAKKKQVSTEVSFGLDPRVHIMSVHSSKGLEFDHVLLGGLYYSYKSSRKSCLGKTPNSIHYYDYELKKRIKSLDYLIEELLEIDEVKSEDMRLFYVACTRAIKSIGWSNLEGEHGKKSTNGSWCSILNNYAQVRSDILCHEEFFLEDLPVLNSSSISEYLKVFPLTSVEKNQVFCSELSATRLSSLGGCPRKFYYESICQVNLRKGEECEAIPEYKGKRVSSKERGTYIHALLSKYITGSSEDAHEIKNREESLSWVLSHIDNHAGSKRYSELSFKVPVNGVMISGAIDLVLTGENKYTIVDFKTGEKKIELLAVYWTQLYIYAIAAAEIFKLSKDQLFDLKLLYVDEKSIETKSLNLYMIRSKLKNIMTNLNRYNRKNTNLCSLCEFKKICI